MPAREDPFPMVNIHLLNGFVLKTSWVRFGTWARGLRPGSRPGQLNAGGPRPARQQSAESGRPPRGRIEACPWKPRHRHGFAQRNRWLGGLPEGPPPWQSRGLRGPLCFRGGRVSRPRPAPADGRLPARHGVVPGRRRNKSRRHLIQDGLHRFLSCIFTCRSWLGCSDRGFYLSVPGPLLQ